MSKPDWHTDGRDWPNRDAGRFVQAGGLRWHVQVAGPAGHAADEGAPVVLLLHGAGAATHSWRDVLPLLARDFTVIAPDLPGHGFTATPAASGLTMPGMAKAVAALLATLGLRPALVAGHSAGAGLALRMSLDGSLPSASLVTLNGALQPFPGAAARLFPALARVLFVNPLMPRILSLQAQRPGAVARVIGGTGSRLDARGIELYARLFRRSGHVAGTLGMMAGWDLATLARDLPGLAAPLTLYAGERDTTVPPSVSRTAAQAVRGAVFEALPRLGHLMHEEEPERFAALIASAASGTAASP